MSDLFVNKLLGSVLGTGLALLGLNAAGEMFFNTKAPEKPGYLVAVDTGEVEVDEGPVWIPPTDYGVLLANADVAAGEKKSAACTSCHTFEQGGATKQGPNLYNVISRAKGGVEGFAYTDAMLNKGGAWDFEAMDTYLENPKKYVPGTAMNYAGLRKEKDRMNVIAYLRSLSDSPVAFPAPLPPEALLPPSADAPMEAAHDVVEDTVETVEAVATDVVDVAADAVDATTDAVEAVVEDITISVGEVELSAAPNGVEYKLVDFINSDKEPCTDTECWYTFDRLTFNTGSAELDMAFSQRQLDNIKVIMDAYPTLALKLGGYTDNTGGLEANMALSEARAAAVKTALTDMGVGEDRLFTEGYGPEHPVASNDTEEGRAQNRRIDVRVRSR